MEVCLWKGHGVAPMTVNDVVALHAVSRREFATAAEIKVAPLAVLHFAILHFEVRRQFPTAGLDMAELAFGTVPAIVTLLVCASSAYLYGRPSRVRLQSLRKALICRSLKDIPGAYYA